MCDKGASFPHNFGLHYPAVSRLIGLDSGVSGSARGQVGEIVHAVGQSALVRRSPSLLREWSLRRLMGAPCVTLAPFDRTRSDRASARARSGCAIMHVIRSVSSPLTGWSPP